jgi:hypothetical protein
MPAEYSGIAVLRLPSKFSYSDLSFAVATLVKAIENDSIDGKLWIVECGRIRIYRPD